jgi:hypothetical protein
VGRLAGWQATFHMGRAVAYRSEIYLPRGDSTGHSNRYRISGAFKKWQVNWDPLCHTLNILQVFVLSLIMLMIMYEEQEAAG